MSNYSIIQVAEMVQDNFCVMKRLNFLCLAFMVFPWTGPVLGSRFAKAVLLLESHGLYIIQMAG